MNKGLIGGAAAVSAVAAVLLPAAAQELGGTRYTFGINQRFEAASNLGLEIPDEGETNLSTTTLTFGIDSSTDIQTFSLGLSGRLREGSLPTGSDTQTGFVEPEFRLRYQREGANALFSFRASYRRDDVSFFLPLAAFTNDEGVVEIPLDIEDLRGAGSRNRYNLGMTLETGINSPIGFRFAADARRITYEDTTAPNLFDTERTLLSATTFFRPNEITDYSVTLSQDTFDSDDPATEDRVTRNLSVGIDRAINERSRISASAGYSRIELTQTGVKSNESGATAYLGYFTDMPNGTLGTTFDLNRTQNGARKNVKVTRTFETPLSAFNLQVGATQLDSGTVSPIGSLAWDRELPTGGLTLSLRRDVRLTNDDEERLSTSLNMDYTYVVNDYSNVRLSAFYGNFDATSTSNHIRRTDLTLAYSHALTEDWSLDTGVTWRQRNENTVGSAESTSLFVGIGRTFTAFR